MAKLVNSKQERGNSKAAFSICLLYSNDREDSGMARAVPSFLFTNNYSLLLC
jgi:hypothetical protein